MTNHCVYIIECKDGSFYTGYTNRLAYRLKMHKEGKGAKYTKGRGPLTLKYVSHFDSREAALKEEYRIKQLSRKKKEQLIRTGGEIDLYTKEL